MKNIVYADNAATTQLDKEAFEKMIPFLVNYYGNASQPYSFSRVVKKALIEARQTIARCLNALPEEIYFTSGGTESDNWALKGVMLGKPLSCEIITSEFEHHAILNTCTVLKGLGYNTTFVKPSNDGYININSFSKVISRDSVIASIMMANNELGTIQPIKDLCKVAHENHILFHTDAVQAVGHISIDVKDLGIDILSASAHKFNGPKGIGFLYVRNGTMLHPFLNGGSQEKSLRAGTENIAAIVGMAEALKNNCNNLKENTAHIKDLEESLLSKLRNKDVEFIHNGGDNRLPGLISLSFKNQDGEALLHRLDLLGIEVSTGAACDTVKSEITHVLKAIQMDQSFAKGTIRISIGKNNTSDDIDYIVNGIEKVLSVN